MQEVKMVCEQTRSSDANNKLENVCRGDTLKPKRVFSVEIFARRKRVSSLKFLKHEYGNDFLMAEAVEKIRSLYDHSKRSL